jgi:proton-coupled amino acid transporter
MESSPLHSDDYTSGDPAVNDSTVKGSLLAESRRMRMNVVKAFVGSAVLFLPSTFAHAGLIGAIVGLIAIAAVSILCMMMLVDCATSIESGTTAYNSVGGADAKALEHGRRQQQQQPTTTLGAGVCDYGDVGHCAFGPRGRKFVDVSLVASQLGFCLVYVNYIAENLHMVIGALTNCRVEVPVNLLILLQLPFFVGLSWVRQLKFFVATNTAANIFILAGLSYIVCYCFYKLDLEGPAGKHEGDDGPGENSIAADGIFMLKPSTFPLFVGSSIYTFEGIGLVLPLFSVASPALRPHYKGVLKSTVYGLLAIYIFIGSIGYVAFGDAVEPAITSSLPERSGWTVGVQLMYCMALMFTYPLMLFPVIDIIETAILKSNPESSSSDAAQPSSSSGGGSEGGCGGDESWELTWKKNAIRAGIVGFTAVASIALEGALDNLVALVGALCSLPLAFIYPSLFHNRLIGSHPRRDMFIAGMGAVTMVGATVFSIATWKSSDPAQCEKQ